MTQPQAMVPVAEPLFFVIYDGPRDFPNEVICRVQAMHAFDPTRLVCGPIVARGPSVQAVRRKIPRGRFCIPRAPNDDPVIVETWI